MTEPYYDEAGITIYHGDARVLVPEIAADVMLTDPPFGFEYHSNRPRVEGNARNIAGDRGTFLRDFALSWWGDKPALVFGSRKSPQPYGVRTVLIWDQGGAVGSGDLSLPWKPSWQEVYVIGGPWAGRRDCGSVLRYPPVHPTGRDHPNEKPVGLISMLLAKCIPGAALDPFMGSGTTLYAAKADGRNAIGIEIEERYCELAAKRLAQEVLDFGASAPIGDEAS